VSLWWPPHHGGDLAEDNKTQAPIIDKASAAIMKRNLADKANACGIGGFDVLTQPYGSVVVKLAPIDAGLSVDGGTCMVASVAVALAS